MANVLDRYFKLIFSMLTALALMAFATQSFAQANEEASSASLDDVATSTPTETAHKAPPAQRQLELELEEVEGATAYEIELRSVVTGKLSTFKMKKPVWKAKVKPGKYKMRLRSYDERGVAGDWSEPEEFLVAFPPPMLLLPKQNASILTGQTETSQIEFSWQAVPGAEKYRIDIYEVAGNLTPENNENTASVATDATTETSVSTVPVASEVVEKTTTHKFTLPVARQYKWKVTALMPTGEDGDALTELGVFTAVAKKLEMPDIERPMDRYVQKLTWEKPARAETFTYALSRLEGKTWRTVEKKSGITANEVDLAYDAPGGRYRLQVRSEAPHTEPSNVAKLEFDVFNGDRSPAAVEQMRLRDSLEKPTTWYAIASYLITNITYEGINADGSAGAQKVAFPDALGGTGRLGLGYFKPNSTHGYIGVVDLGGMNISGENVTFASAEAHYAHRYYFGVNQLRVSGGVFYKELPQTFQDINGKFYHKKISFLGPHIGADFWHPFSFKYGLQLNSRLYVSAFKKDTPNGQDISMSPSYQFGLMGTMRLSHNIIGFAGIAHRQDSVKYKKGTTTATVDNEVTLTGTYLNLMLEYGF